MLFFRWKSNALKLKIMIECDKWQNQVFFVTLFLSNSRLFLFFYYKFSKIEEWKKKLNMLLYLMIFEMKTQKDVFTLFNVLQKLRLQLDLPERELNSFSIWLSSLMMNNKLFWNFSISYLTLVRFLEVKNMKKLCFHY